jgi:hypothetical protein
MLGTISAVPHFRGVPCGNEKHKLTQTATDSMHTTEKLATELDKANLPQMAQKARQGYYHDFLSPLVTPCLQLEADLRAIGTREAEAIRQRHLNGEFDARKEESDAWAESPDGKSAFEELIKRGH